MTRPQRWQRRKEARPAEILSAALDVFRVRGFAAARLEDVAAKAGVSKGTLYLYFPSKEALFKALAREAVLPNIERAEVLVETHAGPASAILRELLTNMGLLMASDERLSALPKLVIAEAGNFPELARFYLHHVIRRGLRLVAGIVSRGIEAGEFRPVDPAAAARLATAPILLLALWHHSFATLDHGGPEAQRIVEDHVEVFLAGLAAPGDAGPAAEAADAVRPRNQRRAHEYAGSRRAGR